MSGTCVNVGLIVPLRHSTPDNHLSVLMTVDSHHSVSLVLLAPWSTQLLCCSVSLVTMDDHSSVVHLSYLFVTNPWSIIWFFGSRDY